MRAAVEGSSCPSHSAMTVTSVPDSNSLIGAECRRVCMPTRFDLSEGQVCRAVATWWARLCSTASRLSRVPVMVGNSGWSGAPPRSVSQTRSTRTVNLVSGVEIPATGDPPQLQDDHDDENPQADQQRARYGNSPQVLHRHHVLDRSYVSRDARNPCLAGVSRFSGFGVLAT